MEFSDRFGYQLSEKLRLETKDFNALGNYDRFVLSEGYLYETEGELKAGYALCEKARRGELITREEFAARVRNKFGDKRVDDLYRKLTGLVKAGVLQPSDVYAYASYGWCLNEAESVVYFQVGPDKFIVNNCDTRIEESNAIVKVCREWGFEASRVKIIGTPYYEATDWQFIRFDCAGMAWLWTNEQLYMVCC